MNQNIYPFAKRAFDIAVSLTALVVLSPILLLVAALIKLESKGPVVYRSKRVGRYYKVFDLFKFRTMQQDADKNKELMAKLNQYSANDIGVETDECPFCKMLGRECSPLLYNDQGTICENLFNLKKDKASAFYKIVNDPRVTPFGKFLRKTSIDELPQLFNILIGDMSLIGNRPLPLYEAEKLTSDHAISRFNAPAGLTGLWQVTKRGTQDISASERINLDKEYSKTWSLKTDLKIFVKTFPALVQQENV